MSDYINRFKTLEWVPGFVLGDSQVGTIILELALMIVHSAHYSSVRLGMPATLTESSIVNMAGLLISIKTPSRMRGKHGTKRPRISTRTPKPSESLKEWNTD